MLSLTAVIAAAALVAIAAPDAASASTFVTGSIPILSSGGFNPRLAGMAVDPNADQAYVADSFDGSVVVIDTGSNRVVGTIMNGPTSIGNDPRAIAFDAPRHQAYVTNNQSDSVSVIDTTTNTVKKVIKSGIGIGPNSVDTDPGLARAYVGNLADGTVSVIDMTTNVVAKIIPHDSAHGIGSWVSDVAVDATLHRAYAVNQNDGSVSVIDTTSDSVIAVIPHGPMNGIGNKPSQVAVDQFAHRAFITNYGDGTVSVIDTNDNSVIKVIPKGPMDGIGDKPIAAVVDPAGQQVYVATDAQITVIDSRTLTVTRVVPNSGASSYGSSIFSMAIDQSHRQAFIPAFDSSKVTIVDLDSTASLSRRGGTDRFDVSAGISAVEFDPGVDVAYVASGGAFADALSGSAAAGFHGGPVLLTATDSIPTAIGAELARLRPKRIAVLGGTASISDAVLRALSRYAPIVDRLAGADRYAVSANISRDTFSPGVPVAYLASGAVFPDALSASAIAARSGGPVLLTTKDDLPHVIVDELARLKPVKVVILGGTNTVSAGVEAKLKAIAPTTRIAGRDRFEVSANASADNFAPSSRVAYVASGVVFPDALSGSPAAAANGAPVLLVTNDAIPDAVARELQRLNPLQIVVLGGPDTVSDTVYELLRSSLR